MKNKEIKKCPLYVNGEVVKELEITEPKHTFSAPDEVYESMKADVLKWLFESKDPEFNIYLHNKHYKFTRCTLNVKKHANGWIQYQAAVCEHWDEIITFRTGFVLDIESTEGAVAENEIISQSYGRKCIPLGYKQ